MAAVGGAVAIEADGWALRIDAASVHRAAVQEVYGGAAPPAAPPRLDYRWLGRYDQPVLTFGREAAADGAVWRRIAARHARTLPTVEARVGRPGGEATISADVALRLWTELVAMRRITFDVTTGDSSAEVFPNVPLVDPHLAGGFLYAGGSGTSPASSTPTATPSATPGSPIRIAQRTDRRSRTIPRPSPRRRGCSATYPLATRACRESSI